MGGEYFDQFVKGDDLQKTFLETVKKAQYDYGHAGYTGTIAEKHEVELRSDKVFTYNEAVGFADTDMKTNSHDKWGPAWAVKVNDPERGEGFFFYGWASS